MFKSILVANVSVELSITERDQTQAHLARVHAAIGERIAADIAIAALPRV